MTAFLAWLYTQYNKAYDWFGSGYWTLKNAAANAWNWAVDQARAALSASITYAYNLFNSAAANLVLWVNWLSQKIASVRDGLVEDILALFEWVEYKLSSIDAIIRQAVENAISISVGFISGILDDLRSAIQAGINWVVGWVTDTFSWMLSLRDRLINLVTALPASKLGLLLEFIGKWSNAVITFFTNPLVFILDVIQETFLSFLGYILAWSLGTTKYDLPKSPPWKGQ